MSLKSFAAYPFSRLLSFAFVLFLAVFSHPSPELVGGNDELGRYRPHFFPFNSGERAEYQASWNGIPVASAEIQASPTVMDGKKFYQVTIEARSWRYLELFWKMRDSIESVFEAETLYPRRFAFHQRENRKKIDTTALFNPGDKKWVVHRDQGSKVKDYEFVSQHTLDPVSAVYLARSLDFKIGDTLRLEVFGGKSRYQVTLEIVGQERIAINAGEFDAYKIIPRVTNLHRSGYAGRVRQATVWISADEKRRPVKIVSQVFIGSVNIELVKEKG